MRWIAAVAALLLATAAALTGCAMAPATPGPSGVIHVTNRLSTPAVVQAAMQDGSASGFSLIVTACGGQVSGDPGRPGLTSGVYGVAVLLDPTGGLDAAVQRANGNLTAVNIPFASMAAVWSIGNLSIAALPRWMTITPAGVTYGDAPDASAEAAACAPWAPSLAPAPSPSPGTAPSPTPGRSGGRAGGRAARPGHAIGPTMGAVPAPDRPPLGGFAIVLIAASLFGTLGPLSRFAYDAGMEPLSFVAWRGAIGLAAVAIFVAWRISRGTEHLVRLRDLDRGARVSLAVAAVMGFTLNLAMFIAFDLVTVALALLGFYTYPVMVAAVNVALGRESLDRPRIVALALAIAGMVAVVASQLDPSAGIRFDAIGFGLALGAAVSQAVFVVISRTGYRRVPATQAMGVVLATTVVCSIAVAAATGAGTALAFPLRDPSVLPLLAFTGLFAAAIPSILFLSGIRLIGGTRAGILMLFEPVVGVALAAWLLDEGLAPIQIIGGLAILAAALILQRSAAPGGRAVTAPAVEADEAPEPATATTTDAEPRAVRLPGGS
jgi:drug/metabolite transporter, DME family